MADSEIGWDAGAPCAAEHKVEPDRQTIAVEAEIPEQPREAQQQDPARARPMSNPENDDLVVKIAVEVDRLGKHGAVFVTPAQRRTIACRMKPRIAHHLTAYLQQHRFVRRDLG